MAQELVPGGMDWHLAKLAQRDKNLAIDVRQGTVPKKTLAPRFAVRARVAVLLVEAPDKNTHTHTTTNPPLVRHIAHSMAVSGACTESCDL